MSFKRVKYVRITGLIYSILCWVFLVFVYVFFLFVFEKRWGDGLHTISTRADYLASVLHNLQASSTGRCTW